MTGSKNVFTMSVDLLKATQIVNKRLSDLKNTIGDNLVIVEEATIEKNYYWVFFYNTKTYLESGNLSYALAGNSPLIVDKIFGDLYETGTTHNIEFYMKQFEKDHLAAIIERSNNSK